MKKILKLSLMVITITLLFMVAMQTSAYAAETISFNVSESVYKAVIGEGTKTYGWKSNLNYVEVEKIREMSNETTHTLVIPIELFEKINTITVTEEVAGLENFTNLETLSITATQKIDLSFLSKLTKLKNLYLKYSDESWYAYTWSAKDDKSKITLPKDILSGVENAKNLEELHIVTSTMQEIDLSYVGKLTNLKSLYIGQHNFQDAPTSQYVSNIKDFSAISTCTKLETISACIVSDKIDFSTLKNMKSLKFLYIYEEDVSYGEFGTNQLREVVGKSKCTGLNFSEISNLTSLENLEVIGVRSINTLNGIENLKNLTSLVMSKCEIKDMSKILNLTNLAYLNLSNNEIKVVPDMSKLTNLTGYNLSKNNLEDVSGVIGLNKTYYSYIDENTILVNTKNKEYALPKIFQQAFLDEMKCKYNIYDRCSYDANGEKIEKEYKDYIELSSGTVNLEIAGGTLSKDNKTAIFPENVKEGDSMCVAINGSMLHETHIVITYRESLKLGDINKDKKIDVNDAIIVLKHITGKEKLTGNDFTRADVTKDSKVDVQDAITILKYIVGKIKSF